MGGGYHRCAVGHHLVQIALFITTEHRPAFHGGHLGAHKHDLVPHGATKKRTKTGGADQTSRQGPSLPVGRDDSSKEKAKASAARRPRAGRSLEPRRPNLLGTAAWRVAQLEDPRPLLGVRAARQGRGRRLHDVRRAHAAVLGRRGRRADLLGALASSRGGHGLASRPLAGFGQGASLRQIGGSVGGLGRPHLDQPADEVPGGQRQYSLRAHARVHGHGEAHHDGRGERER
mmetsp:Transcript_53169/g.172937  ORF Transcript_53169/g.172937 Transcript_53169/m.172937 type:complete len:231 (+) Transcript_53169:4605-5297(+)